MIGDSRTVLFCR